MSKPNELVQGTLDLLILKIVNLEPMHGFGIANRLKQMSSDVLTVSQGSLYPALYKLEQEGWVRAEWKETESKRQAKFYSITAAGRKRLQKEAENWERLSGAISAIVNLEGWEGAK
jgi:PadR family transcriptional regulator, regulatory protein PadR